MRTEASSTDLIDRPDWPRRSTTATGTHATAARHGWGRGRGRPGRMLKQDHANSCERRPSIGPAFAKARIRWGRSHPPEGRSDVVVELELVRGRTQPDRIGL